MTKKNKVDDYHDVDDVFHDDDDDDEELFHF